jgi:hypothetical protein
MNNNIDFIDNYLSGKRSQEKALQFEQDLAAEPTMQQEVDFQKNVVEGIKTFRKTELKSRLNAIDISTVRSSSVWNKVGIAASTILISGAIGLYIANNDNPITVEVPMVTKKVEVKTQPSNQIKEVATVIETKEPAENILLNEELNPKKETQKNIVDEAPVSSVSFENRLPNMAANASDIEIDDQLDSEKNITNSSVKFEESGIKVFPENKKNRFHYKYDGKNVLVQIAKYTDSTPAVLIDFPDKKEVFLNYKGVFYKLDKNKNWDTLSNHVIKNDNLIKILHEKIK